MNTYPLIQEQRKILPFYWRFTRLMMGIALLIALALVAVPLYLIWEVAAVWTWFTIVFIPLGGWIFYAVLHRMRHLSWRNQHLNRTEMDRYQILYIRWNPDSHTPEEHRFERSAIQRVYYGRYLTKEAHFYQRAEFREPVRTIQFWPEIHILYQQGLEHRLCTVRFYEETEANAWLSQLASQGVELRFTMYSTENLAPEAEVRAALEKDEHQEVVPWNIPVENNFEIYRQRVVEDLISHNHPSIRITEEKKQEKEKRSAARKQIKAFRSMGWAWLVFVLQWGIAFLLMELAKKGQLNPDTMFIPFMIWVGMGVLFAFLTKVFVWKHVLIYSAFTFLNAIIMSVSLYETEDISPGARMLDSLGSASLLGILFICVPLLVYRFKVAAGEALNKKYNNKSTHR